jgi:hypothetical protein
MRKMMIAVAAALSLGGRFGGGHFGRGFRGGFRGLYGFGGILPYYGYGNSCYALTPYGLHLKLGGVLTGRHSQSRFASKRSSVRLPIAKRNLEAEHGPYCSHG